VLEEIRPFPVVASAPLSAPVGEHWRSIVVPAKAIKHVFVYNRSRCQSTKTWYIFLEFYTDHCDIRYKLVTGVKASIAEPEP
jgi:hypothetical protein